MAVFVEIFSGSGRLGRKVSELCGWPVLLWDISLGTDYDLTVPKNQQLLLGVGRFRPSLWSSPWDPMQQF